MKNFLKNITLLSLIISVTGCTTNMGNFTAISTVSVRGLEYGGKNRDEMAQITEKSCTHRIYLTRVVAGVVTLGVGWFMPQFDVVLGDDEKDRLNNVVASSIKAAKNKGVFDADLMINSTLKQKNIIIPLVYGYKCYIIEGDAVPSIVRTRGFLEKR